MFLSIIPLDSSIDDEGLTYFAKDELKKDIHIGSLVNIPLRDGIVYGMVSEIKDGAIRQPEVAPKNPESTNNTSFLDPSPHSGGQTIPENLKSIVNIVCTTPLLASYQFSIIQSLASKYFVHIHKVLSLFLPKFVFNALEKKTFEPIIGVESRKSKVESRKISFFHNTKNTPLVEIIRSFLKKHIDLVLVFPDDILLTQTLKHLPELGKNCTIVKNSNTYTKRYKTWLEASKKTNPILAGTRKLLQYNLGTYEKIIYIEDSLARYTHSYEHIYKNIDILEVMSGLGFDITIISTVPTTESMYALKTGNYMPASY